MAAPGRGRAEPSKDLEYAPNVFDQATKETLKSLNSRIVDQEQQIQLYDNKYLFQLRKKYTADSDSKKELSRLMTNADLIRLSNNNNGDLPDDAAKVIRRKETARWDEINKECAEAEQKEFDQFKQSDPQHNELVGGLKQLLLHKDKLLIEAKQKIESENLADMDRLQIPTILEHLTSLKHHLEKICREILKKVATDVESANLTYHRMPPGNYDEIPVFRILDKLNELGGDPGDIRGRYLFDPKANGGEAYARYKSPFFNQYHFVLDAIKFLSSPGSEEKIEMGNPRAPYKDIVRTKDAYESFSAALLSQKKNDLTPSFFSRLDPSAPASARGSVSERGQAMDSILAIVKENAKGAQATHKANPGAKPA